MLKVVEMAFDPIIHTTIYKCILAEIKYFMVFLCKNWLLFTAVNFGTPDFVELLQI